MPTQVLNQTARDDIFQRVLAAVQAGNPVTPGHCLEFAWHGYQIIRSYPGAPRLLIQAGSAQWPRVPPNLDDGVSPTRFTYEWHADSEFAQLFRAGFLPVLQFGDALAASLPEMHVWLGCPETQEIVDFSTGRCPAACRATLGLD